LAFGPTGNLQEYASTLTTADLAPAVVYATQTTAQLAEYACKSYPTTCELVKEEVKYRIRNKVATVTVIGGALTSANGGVLATLAQGAALFSLPDAAVTTFVAPPLGLTIGVIGALTSLVYTSANVAGVALTNTMVDQLTNITWSSAQLMPSMFMTLGTGTTSRLTSARNRTTRAAQALEHPSADEVRAWLRSLDDAKHVASAADIQFLARLCVRQTTRALDNND
jgi:hypothetical protein